MGEKRPTNENIQIGDIFVDKSSSEEGSSVSFYQVVGKRGKTLVELRRLEVEHYFDESCKPEQWKIMVRPLPGQFREKSEVFTTRACDSDSLSDQWLKRKAEGGRYYYYFSKMREGSVYYYGGWDAAYCIAALEREGKLPPRPGK